MQRPQKIEHVSWFFKIVCSCHYGPQLVPLPPKMGPVVTITWQLWLPVTTVSDSDWLTSITSLISQSIFVCTMPLSNEVCKFSFWNCNTRLYACVPLSLKYLAYRQVHTIAFQCENLGFLLLDFRPPPPDVTQTKNVRHKPVSLMLNLRV